MGPSERDPPLPLGAAHPIAGFPGTSTQWLPVGLLPLAALNDQSALIDASLEQCPGRVLGQSSPCIAKYNGVSS